MNDNVTYHDFKNIDKDEVVSPEKPRDNNGNGGGINMNDKYVTHTELELSNQKLLREMDKRFDRLERKMDANKADTDLKFENVNAKFEGVNTKFEGVNTKFESINTKFEKQKVWFYGTAIGIVTATCTIIGLLLKFVH